MAAISGWVGWRHAVEQADGERLARGAAIEWL
jgi:hypothetical protein